LLNGILTFLSPQATSPTPTATELREKLLREKVKALRASNSGGKPNFVVDGL